METKKLFEILRLVNNVYSTRWNDVISIVNVIKNKQAKVIEKKWHEQFKFNNPNYYPLELSKIETWSTFDDDCIHLDYYIENDKLFCKAHIYNGNSFDGHITTLRFTATIELPDSFVHSIENKINYALDRMAENAYKEHLENQKKNWMSNFKSKITGTL